MRTAHSRLLLPLLLSLTVVGSGCAYLSQLLRAALQPPTLRFQKAEVGAFTLNDATINLTWELDNPNPVGVSLANLQYALFVEDKPVVAGAPPLGLRVQPQGTTQLVFPATVRFADLAPVVTTFLEKDHAAYRAAGTIGIDLGGTVVSLPLQHEGTFEVPKVPTVKLLQPRITSLGFTSATVEFPFSVTNRNTYPLPIGNLGGNLLVSGTRVGQIRADNLGLDPKGTREIRVPITIEFAQAGQAAMALQTGKATVGFDGSLTSGSGSIPLKFQQNLSFQR